MTHEFDVEAYILDHFDEIQEEALEKIKTLKYYDGPGWGGGDNSESPSYKMENDGYKHYWVKGWNDDPNWISHAIMFNGGWDTSGTIDLKKVGWEQPDMKITRILNEVMRKSGWSIVLVGYALLKAGATIPMHRDEKVGEGWNNVWHLGLLSPPEDCFFIVEDKIHKIEEGKIIKFDDAKFHSAVNNSEFDRVNLYLKFSKNGDVESSESKESS